jgi:hypothetical protein
MNRTSLLAFLSCVAFPVAAADSTLTLSQVDAQLADARHALERQDFPRAKLGYERILRAIPDYPDFQVSLVRSLIGLGLPSAQAREVLGAIVDEGFGGALDDDMLQKLGKWPGQRELLSRARAQRAPITLAQSAFQIADPRFIAEGMAFDPQARRFFISSTYLRKVIARDPDGRIFDFVASGDHGLLQVLGMKADPVRGRLLILTGADDLRYLEARPQELNRTGIFVYALATGRFLGASWLEESGEHLFNDLVVAPDGSVYVTDSTAGRLYRFAAGRFQALTERAVLLYPNGLDLDPARGRLYVADLRGVFVYDLNGGKLTRLPSLQQTSLVSIDGLYLHRGWLVGVQNSVKPERVAAFKLSTDGGSIVDSLVLERSDVRLVAPTEGVVVGEELYFIGNSNMDLVDQKGAISPEAAGHPVTILRLRLPSS